MTIFTTTITNIYTLPHVEGQSDVVVNVMYKVTGVDGDHTASVDGNQPITIQQTEGFTPYSDLTEDQIIGWIYPMAIANSKASVQGQIDSMISPPVSPTAQPLPWKTITSV